MSIFSKIKSFFFSKKQEVSVKLDSDAIKQLEKKTKSEIEKIGRKIGIELDKRLTKAKLITQVKKHNKNL